MSKTPFGRKGEEFKPCREALMGVLNELSIQTDLGKRRQPMKFSVDWRSRTARFEQASYEIDLKLIRDEWDLLDWVEQLSDKSWITGELLGNFVRAARANLGFMRIRKMA